MFFAEKDILMGSFLYSPPPNPSSIFFCFFLVLGLVLVWFWFGFDLVFFFFSNTTSPLFWYARISMLFIV